VYEADQAKRATQAKQTAKQCGNDNKINNQIAAYEATSSNTPIYEDQLKDWHESKTFTVGTTGLHPQQKKSWGRTPFGESEYETWARKSVQQDPSSLLNFFFSKENIEYIQDRIVSDIKRIKKVDISKQSVDELLIIMRNHYQKALSGWLPHQGSKTEVYPRGETPCSLETQLTRLNKSVLEECIKQTISGIDMYLTYYKDASSLPLPLTHPTYTSQKGSRTLSENVGFNSGHEFTKANNSFNERFNIF
jgi:hypothetical protein